MNISLPYEWIPVRGTKSLFN
jgi:hypothetical protein